MKLSGTVGQGTTIGWHGSSGLLLSELLAGVVPCGGAQDRKIKGLALDSRQVTQGALFLACQGKRSSGHEFIGAAVDQGAVAVIYDPAVPLPLSIQNKLQAQKIPAVAIPALGSMAGIIAAHFYGQPSQQVRVTGVTGTNGKTSVSHFLAEALHQRAAPCGLMGTLGLGLIGAMQPGELTTPDAVTVQAWLAAARNAGAHYAVMEVSSHALDQGRVNGVSFDTAIFTNLSHEHLDYHGDMAHYLAAKARLFQRSELKQAVINIDDVAGSVLLANLPATVAVIRYSLTYPQAELWASEIRCDRSGITMHIKGPGGEGRLNCPLLGRFNAYNLLAALGGLVAMGMPFMEALQRLSLARPAAGRMEVLSGQERKPLVIVDYAHTPDALEQVLRSLRAHLEPGGYLWCVFGCGGERDSGKRPLMGAIAERWADFVVLTNDNPRQEKPAQIVTDILAGLKEPGRAYKIQDRAEAIGKAVELAGPRDMVLIAGKGHEAYQQVGGERYPLSDRELAWKALQQWSAAWC
jgi:UDP-N-acetylmuramoyl-L-alanyl-D-glutamate--2,6-diaminopimelate ligase